MELAAWKRSVLTRAGLWVFRWRAVTPSFTVKRLKTKMRTYSRSCRWFSLLRPSFPVCWPSSPTPFHSLWSIQIHSMDSDEGAAHLKHRTKPLASSPRSLLKGDLKMQSMSQWDKGAHGQKRSKLSDEELHFLPKQKKTKQKSGEMIWASVTHSL